mgnify:CR=1 FL=1
MLLNTHSYDAWGRPAVHTCSSAACHRCCACWCIPHKTSLQHALLLVILQGPWQGRSSCRWHPAAARMPLPSTTAPAKPSTAAAAFIPLPGPGAASGCVPHRAACRPSFSDSSCPAAPLLRLRCIPAGPWLDTTGTAQLPEDAPLAPAAAPLPNPPWRARHCSSRLLI